MTGTEVIQPLVDTQTGYAPEFPPARAVSLAVAPAAADATGAGGWFVHDALFSPDPPPVSGKPFVPIQILGERFNLEADPELGIVISHPKWSLMGYGQSPAEAERMLMDYAGDLAETMVDDSPLEYTVEGNRLRVFVLQLQYLSVS